jgi:endonuclease VIII
MPEGDTIFRTARTLEARLGKKTVVAFSSPMPKFRDVELAGHAIDRIEARGKNLLVFFDDARVLHTHLRMTGSWHVYLPKEKWQRPPSQARVVLEVEGCVAVCFNAPVVELLSETGLRRHDQLRALGPDILAAELDLDEALRRLRARPNVTIGEAVMHQGSIAGIGNVYKSEVLFLCRIDPFQKVGTLPDETLRHLLEETRRFMQTNLTGHARRFGRRSAWVYARTGKACFVCQEKIAARAQGSAMRVTYYCPSCQRELA